MKFRGLAIAWVVVAAVFVILLLVEVSKWRSLTTEGGRAAGERQRLTAEIRLKQEELVAEMRQHAGLLQEMQWTSAGGDPAAFLTRLAELAQEKRMRVMGIGALESQATPQFSKSWHAIQIQAPYREVRELAARVELEKGIIEDVRIDMAPNPQGTSAGSPPPDEVQARFKMTALELSPQAKQVIDRAVAAGRGAASPNAPAPLALPVPTRVAQAPPLGRDPFIFLTAPAPPRPTGAAAAGPAGPVVPPPDRPVVPLEVKGIVGFPDGHLAIVNSQIVKVGDMVSGHRVERITETAVTLREPGASPRTIELQDLPHTAPVAPAAPAAPRR